MKKVDSLNLVIIIAVCLLVISACSPSRISVEEYIRKNQITAGAGTVETPATPEPDSAEEPSVVERVPISVPEDIPIMPGAYQIQAFNSGLSVTYQVDGTIEDAAFFYQEELPNYDWELAGPPDRVIGAIATMLRDNVSGDRLAINMQANELGGFVRLTISISRFD